MAECSGDCGSCASKGTCSSAKMTAPEGSKIKRVIGVVSGKGGVGKSMTCASLACLMARRGYSVGIIDGDITGPSQPRIFGLKGNVMVGDGKTIFPAVTVGGIKVISINLMVDQEDTPVIWRGALLANCLKQFWNDVLWDDVDYMFVDMPPGTGDIPLTVFQSYPLDGIVIVTSPQDLVSMIVKKAYKMAKMMDVPVLGVVENMSYYKCDCGRVAYPFGKSKIDEVASELGLDVLAKLPIREDLASACDHGKIEESDLDCYESAALALEAKLPIQE